MKNREHRIFTIGHSTHSLEEFIALLQQHGITALADVRSAPFSRFNPQFNKDALEQEMKSHDIKYVFLGRELGARREDPSCYKNGQVQYERLKNATLFLEGIDRVIQGAEKHNIALMCAEKEPSDCHRTFFVARALKERGVSVSHILDDGSLESHEITMKKSPVPALGDLFHSNEELALAWQEKRGAYVDKKQIPNKR